MVVCGKPTLLYRPRHLSLRLSEIRAIGVGELLARIDRLRRLLEAEGLFDPRLKRPLPFLPSTVGLITGRASAAEHDVTTVASARWPAVVSPMRNTAVQGPTRCTDRRGVGDLDGDPEVDVIVLARGGGSVEDLLPFSDETLCRAIAACTTPVMSAVGHEPDNPLCDLVADLRAATPTDAAKRVVPDTAAELARSATAAAQRAGAAQLGIPRTTHTGPIAKPPGVGRPTAALTHAAKRSSAPAPPFAVESTDGGAEVRPRSVIWPRGWPRLGRRPRWPGVTPWSRPYRGPGRPSPVLRRSRCSGWDRLRIRVSDGAVGATVTDDGWSARE